MFRLYYIITYPLTLIFLIFIWTYRALIRHALGKSCMYQPTCSKYALDSVREFGFVFGGILAIKRIMRCRPTVRGGIDLPKLNLMGNYKWKC